MSLGGACAEAVRSSLLLLSQCLITSIHLPDLHPLVKSYTRSAPRSLRRTILDISSLLLAWCPATEPFISAARTAVSVWLTAHRKTDPCLVTFGNKPWKKKLQIRPRFQGQAQFSILPCHQLLFHGAHECLMKKYVDEGDDALQEIGIVFLSTAAWSWGVPLVCY